ncbi:ArsR family transcriptional regulator [Paenarthrobacter sp. DKR-5]|uniref:ArsR/SmtB family transcription factor n=1 Tax=Paenarthrobacter sp. DKR-5 TaxID=2835535 RepID=UPI001BDCBDDA|nr:metalloregulator ArsR/SmtB family transcription factor [Paenarthrobacter sp. DKR-5]MBT1001747.1 ArsR family transcriptional regulator [Paenarthrobacter sp. DKR-5]
MDKTWDSPVPLSDVRADLFKGLAHPARIQILEILSAAESEPVSSLRTRTGLEASNLSQHLGVLRRNHLITASRRDGQLYYQLACPEVEGLLTAARLLLQTLLETTRHHLRQASSEREEEVPPEQVDRDIDSMEPQSQDRPLQATG